MITPNNRYLPISIYIKVKVQVIAVYEFSSTKNSWDKHVVRIPFLETRCANEWIDNIDYYRWLGLKDSIVDSFKYIGSIKRFIEKAKKDFKLLDPEVIKNNFPTNADAFDESHCPDLKKGEWTCCLDSIISEPIFDYSIGFRSDAALNNEPIEGTMIRYKAISKGE